MKITFTYKIFFFALCYWCANALQAQQITITGTVYDDDMKEPMAFANVYVRESIGTSTDLDGKYTLTFDIKNAKDDTIIASMLSYEAVKKVYNKTQNTQIIDFRLKSSAYAAEEIVVVAGENPANEIMRNIVKNKKENHIEKFDAYEMERYSKVELDLENIDPRMKDRKMFKEVQFIFENIDSTSDEKPFLPMYVVERFHDIKFMNKERKEIMTAQKVSGIENQSVIEFIDMMHDKYNVYDNKITMLGKDFTSPFANNGLMHYEYYILDSMDYRGKWSYKLKFKPRRKGEATFFGEFWVSMEDYAIQQVSMRMSPDVNINLVNRILIYADFEKNQDSIWVPLKEKTIIDFSPAGDGKAADEVMGIIGRTTYMYKDFKPQTTITEKEFRKIDPTYINAYAIEKSDSFWEASRYEKLSENEARVYAMIDTIKTLPMYRTWSNVLGFLGSGFWTTGPIEWGEYWNTFYYNQCEGYRLGTGIGTSNNFSKKLRLYGYAGYGLKDHRWKYSGLFQYVFNREKRTQIGASYTNTISFESGNSEELPSQSMMAGLFRRDIDAKLIGVKEAKIYYQHGFRNGIQARLALIHRQLQPEERYYTKDGGGFRFVYQPDANDATRLQSNFNTFEAVFKLRFAYKERLLMGNFTSVSLGSKYPIVVAQYTAGLAGVMGSQYNYHKFMVSIDDWFPIGIFGWIDYNLEFGKTLGNLPYLLLKAHPGNEALFYNGNAFNNMNSFEFVSDAYVQWKLEHHMDGLLLDRIPLIRKLKWRNVWAFRGAWGTLSAQNAYLNRFNHYSYNDVEGTGATQTFFGAFGNKPYMEASFGFENIFKVLRVDGVWRLTYRDNPNIQRFSIRMTLSFYF